MFNEETDDRTNDAIEEDLTIIEDILPIAPAGGVEPELLVASSVSMPMEPVVMGDERGWAEAAPMASAADPVDAPAAMPVDARAAAPMDAPMVGYAEAPVAAPGPMGAPIAAPVAPVPPVVAPVNESPREETAPRTPIVEALKQNNLFLMGVLAAVFCIMGAAVIFPNNYDNDVWFLLSTGREIVDNGIPYTNPFSMYDGLGIVVQQWLVCVWLYLLYSVGGFVATGLWVMALYGAFVFSAYRLGRLLRGNSFGGEWLMLALLVVSYCMTFYMTIRPHLYSMIAFIWIVFFLEKYRRTGALKWLVPIPFIAALHINVQAAIAPFDLVLIGCYLIPDLLRPFHDRGHLESIRFADAAYARLPLLVVLIVSAAAFLLNPYVLDGALYLINSYGSAEYSGYVTEMAAFVPAESLRFMLILLVLLVACICIGKAGARSINLPLVLLLAGTTYMAFDHTRNIWLCSLFCYVLIAWATRDLSMPWPRRLARSEMACIIPLIFGIAVSAVLVVLSIPRLQALPENDQYTPVAAMDYLDERGIDKEKVNVFTFFNSGGYIEWRGYKVNMDPRPEIWAPRITGADFDYYEEYVDMAQGRLVFNLYMDKYDFDVFVVPSDEASNQVLDPDWNYMKVPGGTDYSVYVKRSLISHDASTAKEIELPD